jgi:uncharacterized protein YdgA (DUF945 family)
MFKRGLLVIVAVIVVVLAGAPFVLGMITESGFMARIEDENANPVLAAKIESYERGWFSSKVKLTYGLSETYLAQLQGLSPVLPVDAIRSFGLPVIVEVGHGPILTLNGFAVGSAAVKAYLDPSAQMVSLAQAVLDVPYLIELHGTSGFGSGFAFEGDVPATKGQTGDFEYDFSGIDFSGLTKRDSTRFKAELGNLAVQSPLVSANLASLVIQGDNQKRADGIKLGTGGFSIARVTVTNPLMGATPVVALTDLTVTSDVDDDAAGANTELKIVYGLGSLTVPGQISMTDFALGLNLMHIDNSAVLALQNVMKSVQPGANEAQLMAAMAPVLGQIVKGSPTLSIDPMRFSMPEGKFEGHLSVAVNGDLLPSDSAATLQNPMAIVSALTAECELKASKGLIGRIAGLVMQNDMPPTTPAGEPIPPDQRAAMASAQVDQVLVALSAQGILVDNGDSYSTMLKFANGQATANGQPVPLGL